MLILSDNDPIIKSILVSIINLSILTAYWSEKSHWDGCSSLFFSKKNPKKKPKKTKEIFISS